MIVAVKDRTAPPYDTSELYVLALGASRPPIWSLDSFFFSSDDGQSLVRALPDSKDRLLTALQSAATQFASRPCASDIADAITRVTAYYVPPPPPLPRYPAVGDVGVIGYVKDVAGPRTRFDDSGNPYNVWSIRYSVPITENGYAIPTSYDAEKAVGFLLVSIGTSLTPFTIGDKLLFDIVQGRYAMMASNLRSAA